MGSVYLVENTELEREEALKVPHFADGDDPQLRERFLREAKSAAKLEHANLCPVYDAGVLDGIHFLTMRFLKGKLLSDYTGKAQPARKAVEIVTKLAQALEAAHGKGVIHRDLKPSNVMMVAGVGPVVMDFGLAKQVRQPDHTLTQVGSMLGTPAYMPPEQVNGELERMGPASDVYSLGVILYELLTGRLPFEGTMAAILGQILYAEPPLPSALVPGLNPALDGICRKAMAKASTDRYPSMKAFAKDLLDFLRSTPVTAGAGNLVPTAGDKPAIFQAATVAPGRQPADYSDVLQLAPTAGNKAAIFQAATVAPGRQPAGNSDVFQASTVAPRVVKSTSGATKRSRPSAKPSRNRDDLPSEKAFEAGPPPQPWFWSSQAVGIGVACALLTIAIGLWAVGAFRARTADGILVIKVNEPNPELYVDGEKVTVSWQNGGMKAEVGVNAGKRKVELKKKGFSVYGKEVTLEDHGRTELTVRLEPNSPMPPRVGRAVGARQHKKGEKRETAGGGQVKPRESRPQVAGRVGRYRRHSMAGLRFRSI